MFENISPGFISFVSFAWFTSTLGAILFAIRDVFVAPETLIKREIKRLPKFLEAKDSMGRFDVWFERTMYMSGIAAGPLEGALLMIVASTAAGGAVWVSLQNEMLALVAAGAALGLVLAGLTWAAHRRRALFEQQFPVAIELLARAVRAGESLEQGLELVGESTAAPVGTELTRCAKQLDLGLALPTCMHALAHRVDLMDVRIFANAVAVHREAGGNLPITLERLAEVIRDRHSYHRQLKSVTTAGRTSAMVIATLGPLIFGYMFFLQPEYGSQLLNDHWGRAMLAVAVILQVIGIFWMSRLSKSDY